MPSSSARCAQLPRAMDKVPFYAALKKFRDFLNGLIPEIDDSEVVFNDPKIRAADDGTEISDHLKGIRWNPFVETSVRNFPRSRSPRFQLLIDRILPESFLSKLMNNINTINLSYPG